MRRVIPVLAVVLLVAAVWFFWPDATDSPTTTTPETSGSTTTTTTSAGPTTTDASPTTTDTSHVVETVEEAEAILRAHYTRWFRGIYAQDEDEIRRTVVSEAQVAAAIEQFGVMQFTAPPSEDGLEITDVEILRSDEDCLAVWAGLAATFKEGSTSGIVIFRRLDGEWRFLSSWTFREDLWEADCEGSL